MRNMKMRRPSPYQLLLLTEANDWTERIALLLQRESVYNLLGQRSAQAQDLLELRASRNASR